MQGIDPVDPVQGWTKAQVVWPAGGSRTQDELEEDLGREIDPEKFEGLAILQWDWQGSW